MKMKQIYVILLICLATQFSFAQNPAAVEKVKEAGRVIHRSFFSRDSLAKAIRLYDEAIKIDSTYSLAYWYKAAYLNEIGEKEEASRVYLSAEKYNLSNPYYYTPVGISLEKHGKVQEAHRIYEKVKQLFEVRMRERFSDNDFYNWLFVKYLLDNKRMTIAEIEQVHHDFGGLPLGDKMLPPSTPDSLKLSREYLQIFYQPEEMKKSVLKDIW
jgi:tetratricopeptide (TPR) repeat protein